MPAPLVTHMGLNWVFVTVLPVKATLTMSGNRKGAGASTFAPIRKPGPRDSMRLFWTCTEASGSCTRSHGIMRLRDMPGC